MHFAERHATVRVAVMITTFRRLKGLQRTLESVALQEADGLEIEIHVIDNGCEAEVERLVKGCARRSLRPVVYHSEPQRGVASARNHALGLVTAAMDYVAFIDDDEVASPLWLKSLVKTAQAFSADIVQGPVEPDYEIEAPRWLRDGRLTALGPFQDGGELRFGFSGNVLLSAAMLRETGLRFEPCFDRSGGEDQHFFMALMERGYRIVTSRDAIVFETIPASRMSLAGWLQRRYRIGATLTLAWRMLRRDAFLIPKRATIGAGHIVLGTLACAQPWRWNAENLAFNLGRVAYGLGQVAGAAGLIGRSYDRVHVMAEDRSKGGSIDAVHP